MGRSKVFGWGVNDADHLIAKVEVIGGKKIQTWICPYYKKWASMLSRVFSEAYHKQQPTYVDAQVTEDWKYLSNFIKWVDSQPNRDWENCELDKDFLSGGSVLYSQTTCVFISKALNTFTTDRRNSRGKYLLGVSWHKQHEKFISRCNNPFSDTGHYLGYFANELEAHKAWQAKKHGYACALADLQDDPRVADALRQRYAPDKDWSKL